MPELTATRMQLTAAAGSHTGLRRENNEDRCHADAARGIFFVIDGVGGHAAGERAADIAFTMLRARLERETGTVAERVREAITLANNEIHRVASSDAQLAGMACVLTVAVVREGQVTIGHVGDSRLYKLRPGSIQKLTRDHSPIGDREDRGEISEREAMQHPRRNEIYRDVGSEPHGPDDAEFVDIVETELEADAALLLCSDGLSDLVPAAAVAEIAAREAGAPERAVRALIQAAIEAGGKDNVSVVFVEADAFAAESRAWLKSAGRHASPLAAFGPRIRAVIASRGLALVAGVLLGMALLLGAVRWTSLAQRSLRDLLPPGSWPRGWVVNQDGSGDFRSIGEALASARSGDTINVEPGEYAERLVLTGQVSIVSTLPRGARIVRAADASERTPAIDLQAGGARISGFRIIADATRPLDVGLRMRRASGEADNLEITGTRVAAIEIDGPSEPVVRGSYLHENSGYGIRVGAGARPKLLHNVIADNGRQADSPRAGIEVHEQARPVLFGNIVVNNGVDGIRGLTPAQHADLLRDNIIGRVALAPSPAAVKPPAAKRPR
ncbi:MAG: protein phosphatase 2C domain-containing protein [Bacteroidales bacterium]